MKWKTLKHSGVAFPPTYVPRGLSVTIDEVRIQLTPQQEEMIYAWAKKKDTPYVNDTVFAENFVSDFSKLLPTRFSGITVKSIDFTEVYAFVDEEKVKNSQPEVKKQLSMERKRTRDLMKERYGYAEIDGVNVEVANWMVEPPGIFMGRGEAPRRGRWKPRVQPEDVTLNLGEDAPVPAGNWGSIVHEHDVMWLASWTDKLSGDEKYVWLSDRAFIRQTRDKAKYDKAWKLEKRLDKVRQYVRNALGSGDERVRKLATVSYLIDKLAMRVGDEKDDDEADTVGASTLRVEHVTLDESSIRFDFLGKDSVRWQKSLMIGETAPLFAENLKVLLSGKESSDLVFDDISSSQVNRFLAKAMPELTAKVFRTFHATDAVSRYLATQGALPAGASTHLKLYHAKLANLEAAIRCNHQRTPPKKWEENLVKKEEKLRSMMVLAPKSDKAKVRLEERVEKMKLALELVKKTRDYNLNTSLRNYIDPRVYKAWSDHVSLDWSSIYSKTLHRKFQWAGKAHMRWESIAGENLHKSITSRDSHH